MPIRQQSGIIDESLLSKIRRHETVIVRLSRPQVSTNRSPSENIEAMRENAA